MLKKIVLLLCIILFCVLIGCKPPENIIENNENKTINIIENNTEYSTNPQKKEPITNTPTKNTVESKNKTTNIEISGSLKLQNNLNLCPHIKKEFKCDRLDIKYCDYKKIIGQNGFFPEYLICRSGNSKNNEDPEKKYCLIQDCDEITKNNLVIGYGGPVTYAEYDFTVQDSGEISSSYSLSRCGEEDKVFKTQDECTYFRKTID